MKPLSPKLLEALRHLDTFHRPAPMRELARSLFIPPQRMASRVWRLRLRGFADKPGDEAYCITPDGGAYLEAARYTATVKVDPQVPTRDRDHDDKSLRKWHTVVFAGPEVADEEKLIELALDEFHETVPISCLDHFEITVTKIKPCKGAEAK